MEARATSKDPSIRIRFPKSVLRKIDGAAKESGRSRNTEVIYRLAESFRAPPEPSSVLSAAEAQK